MVRKGGFEPPRPCEHKLLRLARLPVPPLPRCDRFPGHTRIGDYSWKVEWASTELVLLRPLLSGKLNAGV